jgi:hypothetical protein
MEWRFADAKAERYSEFGGRLQRFVPSSRAPARHPS